MTKSRFLMLAAILVILGGLVYLQIRTWTHFDWATFADVTGDLARGRGVRHLAIAVALIYFTYWLRAVRWKLFLKPVCDARLRSLTPSQFIGFSALALLGRPGELVRPYLIAKKENLTFSSQLAVWAVERIFDTGAFAVLISVNVFLFGSRLPHSAALRQAGVILLGLVAVLAGGALLVRRNGAAAAKWVERRFSGRFPRLAKSVSHKVHSFGDGLNTIHDGRTFLQLIGVSLLIWFTIALAYRFILHAYPQPVLRHMHIPQVLLLMAASMVGSMVQLPAVGGGSQLAVISMLSSQEWFSVPKELAVSAGMLVWLVTFIAVVPVGLLLSHHERISIRRLSEETIPEEEHTVG